MVEKNKIQKKSKTRCNCLCCKYCNDYWTEYKPNETTSNLNSQNNTIKYRKKFTVITNVIIVLNISTKKKTMGIIYSNNRFGYRL